MSKKSIKFSFFSCSRVVLLKIFKKICINFKILAFLYSEKLNKSTFYVLLGGRNMDFINTYHLSRWTLYAKNVNKNLEDSLNNGFISPLPTNNFPIYKGQIFQYVSRFDNNNNPIFKLAISLEDSMINDTTVFICPLETFNKINTRVDSKKFVEIGILPLISKNNIFYARLEGIKMINKKLVNIKDNKILFRGYGYLNIDQVERIQLYYLRLANKKFELNKNYKKNNYIC